MFHFYCFHIFGFGFQILFFGLVILFFWFWVLVKCKKWFIFCIWFCFFIYFILFYIGYTPLFYSVFPFLFGIPHWSPPFIQSLKTNLFLFVIHSLLLLLPLLLPLLLTASFKSSSLVVVRRLFVPAKCVRIKKLCKTHYKCHYTTMIYLNTHLFLYASLSLQLSLEKKQLFFIHFAFSLSVSKKCCVVLLTTASVYYMQTIQCNVIKKEKVHRQRYGLTCTLKK